MEDLKGFGDFCAEEQICCFLPDILLKTTPVHLYVSADLVFMRF